MTQDGGFDLNYLVEVAFRAPGNWQLAIMGKIRDALVVVLVERVSGINQHGSTFHHHHGYLNGPFQHTRRINNAVPSTWASARAPSQSRAPGDANTAVLRTGRVQKQ